jgi:predicted small secreted protein
MRRIVIGLAVLCSAAVWGLAAAGCNTVEGAGTDIKMAGDGVKEAFRPYP